MNFYEINNPYYAVIAAKDENHCLELYEEVICDIEGKKEFSANLVVLSDQAVINQLALSEDIDSDLITYEEAEQIVREADFENGEVMLMDGSLI